MELRKLDNSEHIKTRALWEKVFSEDSKDFLDYYYFFKTRDNEIYVVEEEGAIRSMLHLNPYQIRMGGEEFPAHYIIAVATEPEYRKRGYMGALLRQSMQEMYARKEPFTFLMPAAEAIYSPYDFRFVYRQKVQKLKRVFGVGMGCTEMPVPEGGVDSERVTVSEAGIGDGAELAAFFEKNFSGQFQVYAVRDEAYYQTLLFEQQSERGGIKMVREDGRLIGFFLYSDERGLEIREPLFLSGHEEDYERAVVALCREHRAQEATIYAEPEERTLEFAEASRYMTISETTKKPVIMVRILHLESLLKLLKVRDGEQMDCSFAVLDSILPQNSRIWRIFSAVESCEQPSEATVKNGVWVRETEDSEGVLTIAALTSLLFGYKDLEEIAAEEDVILTEHLKGELSKLEPLKHIYLNESV